MSLSIISMVWYYSVEFQIFGLTAPAHAGKTWSTEKAREWKLNDTGTKVYEQHRMRLLIKSRRTIKNWEWSSVVGQNNTKERKRITKKKKKKRGCSPGEWNQILRAKKKNRGFSAVCICGQGFYHLFTKLRNILNQLRDAQFFWFFVILAVPFCS